MSNCADSGEPYYRIEILGSMPPGLVEGVSGVHAEAIRAAQASDVGGRVLANLPMDGGETGVNESTGTEG